MHLELVCEGSERTLLEGFAPAGCAPQARKGRRPVPEKEGPFTPFTEHLEDTEFSAPQSAILFEDGPRPLWAEGEASIRKIYPSR
jgi:hypothetical protein